MPTMARNSIYVFSRIARTQLLELSLSPMVPHEQEVGIGTQALRCGMSVPTHTSEKEDACAPTTNWNQTAFKNTLVSSPKPQMYAFPRTALLRHSVTQHSCSPWAVITTTLRDSGVSEAILMESACKTCAQLSGTCPGYSQSLIFYLELMTIPCLWNIHYCCSICKFSGLEPTFVSVQLLGNPIVGKNIPQTNGNDKGFSRRLKHPHYLYPHSGRWVWPGASPCRPREINST